MTSLSALPAEFRSVYRLFLRATSSAVRHDPPAVRRLRKYWKPVFRDAALKLKLLQDPVYESEHERMRGWLHMWENRVDNTISLLYNSSHSLGLPHKVSRNISEMLKRIEYRESQSYTTWKPNQDPNSPEYAIPDPNDLPKRGVAKLALRRRTQELENRAFNALEEVVKMAEGRHEIILPRIKPTLRLRPYSA